MFINDKSAISHGDSIWLRDLLMMDSLENGSCNNISRNTFCKVKDDKNTSFWFSKCIGNQPLKDAFPELFALTTNPIFCAADLGLEDLQELLADKTLVRDVGDEFDWLPENDDSFSIKSAHADLLSRLLTRDQLVKKRILFDDRDKYCVFCFKVDESKHHVFSNCNFNSSIWTSIVTCLGPDIGLSAEDVPSFSFKPHMVKVIEERKLGSVIWLAAIWNIWLMRNGVMFINYIPKFEECRPNIKVKA
ncbi:hypothetical protein KIW84_060353 [Lathyrus oleraceus]|uniref:Reverse transcriptase zinc-binding domain-containing protein n=1 Tax=Pisum sativum TaxID=3888 RepID=A0A9D4W141_PEA|nr:hypothetical protein KIW84_060353 [Pisum sativum]